MRHAIVGHFGPPDTHTPPPAAGEKVTRLDLLPSGRHLAHGIGKGLTDLQRLGVTPTEVGLDLLILAAMVHAADTRISRLTESQDGWTRELRLVAPASDVALWEPAAPVLQRMLGFLTGDRWTVEFRPRPGGFARITAPRPQDPPPARFDGLCLFSGGLDSLIGAIDLFESGKRPLLVSHAGEGAVSRAQAECLAHLRSAHSEDAVRRWRAWMAFPKRLVEGVKGENSTRGRSFLFFSLGVFAATGYPEPFELRVPENGLIALNVPMDRLRLGALSTRTTHPFYIARWNELLGQLGLQGSIVNPYWSKTKGEMLRECADPRLLTEALPASMSCSSPSKGRWLGRGPEHCGHCLPCLIRRAAVAAAFDAPDPTRYTLSNLSARPLDTLKAEGQQVRSVQLAVARLRQRPQLSELLIHKPGSLSDVPERLGDLADVYRRGMDEVGALVASVRTRPGRD